MRIDAKFRTLIQQGRALKRFIRRGLFEPSHYVVGREPAFDPETMAWFVERLGSARSYLEYGAGASTLLVADRGLAGVSIESDAKYARAVRRSMPKGTDNLVAHIDIGSTEDWGYPLWLIPTARTTRRWRAYPMAGPRLAEQLPSFPDLILIDGRFRVASCLAMAKAAAGKEGRTQILFDDYAPRPHYHCVEDVLGAPERIGRSALFALDGRAIDVEALDKITSSAMLDYR